MFYAYGMSITLRYANSRDEASEILNDAFMKVFDNIKSFNPNRSFKPWLRTIIVNTAINHFHKTNSNWQREGLEAVKGKIGIEETVISGISYQEIIELVQELSPAYRMVFNLYVIEGFRHREIAEMLGISVGTSKSNLAKAKKNLQALLERNLI